MHLLTTLYCFFNWLDAAYLFNIKLVVQEYKITKKAQVYTLLQTQKLNNKIHFISTKQSLRTIAVTRTQSNALYTSTRQFQTERRESSGSAEKV